jgi:integrase/recombinase XerC
MANIKIYINNFLDHIRIEKNYSETTKQTYLFALNIFLLFLKESNLEITNRNIISGYILFLKKRENSDITIAHRLAILKTFFSYLEKIKKLKKNKLPEIEKYKTTRKIISIPSDDEVNLFIDSIETEYKGVEKLFSASKKVNERIKAKFFSLIRDLTFFTLITATGMRISEALNIQLDDINWIDRSIKILGKGSKERFVFFGIPKLNLLFSRLIKMIKDFGIESHYLFVSYQHRKPLSSRYIQMIMKEFLNRTSSKDFTPHTLRHYYATSSIEKGANIKAISILLGHADVSTTLNLYFHISKIKLKEVFDKFNPFSNITSTVKEMMKKRYETLVNF